MHYISNCGCDENGGYHGGAAGDQTGGEWKLCGWYSYPWNCVLRHPDAKVRAKIADLASKAAKNDKIGYDQYQRDTYWIQLQKAGYDPSKITTACESDCSAGVIANVKATGYLLGLPKLKNISATYTGNMRAGFQAAGFTVLTAGKYLTSPDYLLPGDILLNDANHTATNVSAGSKTGSADSEAAAPAAAGGRCGTCTVTLGEFIGGAEDPEVKTIQILLKAKGYKGRDGKVLKIDGVLGDNTQYAITRMQKKAGMKGINFGTVSTKTWQTLIG